MILRERGIQQQLPICSLAQIAFLPLHPWHVAQGYAMSSTINQADSSSFSVERYLQENSEKGAPGDVFDKESERILRIDVDGGVWLKPGSAIAYRGQLSFERLPILKGHSLKEMAFRQITPLARAVGKGRLYCAHRGHHLRVLQIAGGKFASVVNRLSLLKTSFSSRCHSSGMV